MEKIVFSNHIFENQSLSVYNNLSFIIGDNGSGKTQILNTLSLGFQGKSKTFKVDGQSVLNGQYQVVFLQEFFDIQTEIKINRTSQFRNEILKVLNKFTIKNEKYEDLMKKIDNLNYDIESIVNDNFANNFSSIVNSNIKLKAKLELNSLENIVDKLLKINIYDTNGFENKIIDDSNYSRFILRMLILNILYSYLEVDKQRPLIFLIDLPELYGTPKLLMQVNNFLKKLLQKGNIFVFITTNSPWYLENFCPYIESINFINNKQIYKINDSKKIIFNAIVMYSYFTSDSTDFIWYKSNIKSVIEDQDIEEEIKQFYEQSYTYLVKIFFTHSFILSSKFQKDILLENNDYIVYIFTDFKIQLILFYISKYFNIKCKFDKNMSNINKVLYLLDDNDDIK